jgi:hypothetical protein
LSSPSAAVSRTWKKNALTAGAASLSWMKMGGFPTSPKRSTHKLAEAQAAAFFLPLTEIESSVNLNYLIFTTNLPLRQTKQGGICDEALRIGSQYPGFH